MGYNNQLAAGADANSNTQQDSQIGTLREFRTYSFQLIVIQVIDKREKSRTSLASTAAI